MQVKIVQKYQFYGIPFIFIISLCNYYQLFDVLSAVCCAEILYCGYYERISKFSLIDVINLTFFRPCIMNRLYTNYQLDALIIIYVCFDHQVLIFRRT